MDVVATLGELAATMAGLDRDMLLAFYPRSLHKDLRRFSQGLHDILNHRNVTSLGQRGVTSLSQALATMGDTLADVRATVSAWQDQVDTLYRSWDCLALMAMGLSITFQAMVANTGLVRDPEDDPADWGTVEGNMKAVARLLPVAPASAAATNTREEARRGWRVKEALALLYRFGGAYVAATKLPEELQECLSNIEAALEWTEEASPNVPEDLVDAVNEFEWLWEGNACLARDLMLDTLGNIDFLLSSPYGGPSGPISPVALLALVALVARVAPVVPLFLVAPVAARWPSGAKEPSRTLRGPAKDSAQRRRVAKHIMAAQ
ncbi:hypothetical protein HGM15179_017395 [Zosterops borbonicus]|uniref:Uncharacterized protein n=1 Tax=Zosterops borbonicus TaxID=364589 RepID=A0A8K1G0X3_9PASS|nr:hypothetical protein HGM15179_017395 [Zosterops borbonicus]